MDSRILKQYRQCEVLLKKLEVYNHEAKEDIRYCVGGSVKKEYLDSCELVEKRIKKIKRELQQLQELLLGLEK